MISVPKKWSSPKIPKITPIYGSEDEKNNFVRPNTTNQSIEKRLPPRIIFAGEEYPEEVFLTEFNSNPQNQTPRQIGIRSTGSEKDLIDEKLSEIKFVPLKQEGQKGQLLTLDSSYRISTSSLMSPASQITFIASPRKITNQNLSRIKLMEKESNIPLIPLPLTAPSLAQSLPVSLPPKVEIVELENYIIPFDQSSEYDHPIETLIPYPNPVSVKKNQVYNCVICNESEVGTDDVLSCGHPICETCISLLPTPYCPFDDTPI